MSARRRLTAKLLGLILLLGISEVVPSLISPSVDNSVQEALAWARPILRFAAILLAINVGLSLFRAAYRRQKDLAPGQNDSMLLGLTNIYYIVVAFLVFGGLIRLYGLDFSTLFTSLSIIAAAIAIVTRDFIVEIIAGLIMSLSGQLAVGDYISIGDTKGKVTTLTLTKTVLLSEDEDLVHVPNTTVFGGELVNYTRRMQRRVSIEFEVALSALRSVDNFEQELIGALVDFEAEVVPGSYSLRVVHLHKDYAEFKFRYTLRERQPELERDIRRRTSRRVIDYVHAAGRHDTVGGKPKHSAQGATS